MPKTDWLRRMSVKKKLSIIVSLIVAILIVGLLNFWFSMKIMSGIRGYVGGEGQWSKAEKQAYNSLLTYSISKDEADYQKFRSLLEVTLGDKAGRLELEKPHPDLRVVREGYLKGGIHPDDIDDLIFLHRLFRHVGYMEKAIDLWTVGDQEIEQLMAIGERVHGAQGDQLAAVMQEARALDKVMTQQQREFSSALAEGYRGVKNILLWITFLLGGLLGAFVLLVAILIVRTIVQVDRAKTEFLSMASHQLRTPATAIGWYAQLLYAGKAGPLDKNQEKYVSEIYHGNQRMIHLINNLLDISKIEIGKMPLSPKVVHIKPALESIIQEQKIEIVKRSLTIDIAEASEQAEIITDPLLLDIVLGNLISNAVKYSLENGTVRCRIEKKSRTLTISIADNGIGIPAKERSNVFEKLFRATNALEHDNEGTGLGLYIAKEVTRILKGRLWMENDPIRGTIFYVELPVKI